MPLPEDPRIVSLAERLLQQFDLIFGLHPGFRPAHAKGILLTGSFTPAENARQLSKASHLARPTTPVTVRFSNSTGFPSLPDNVPDANPRGLAVRFHLAEHVHTDLISHSTDGFPTRTGDEFLEMLRAVAASGPDAPSPKPIEQFLQSHPAALAFVQAPKPVASSFARETYFGVTAVAFINASGQRRYGRYRIAPLEGNDYLAPRQVAHLSPDHHFEEIVERVARRPVRFRLLAQLAGGGDRTDDATVHWPQERELFNLGTLELTMAVEDSLSQQKHIIFDPIPRVDGIEPSADPLLELRAAIYLLSGRRRRAAPEAAATPAHAG